MGVGDGGLGIGPNPQSPIPNPQSPIPNPHIYNFYILILKIFNFSSFKTNIKKIKIKKYIRNSKKT